jgi:putative sterol carrier protein
VNAHLDTSGGEAVMEMGHLENPDLTVTTDWATAKAITVDGDAQAGMQAFMQGKVKVQGDMSKLMLLQQAPTDPIQTEIQDKVKEITE